MCARLSTFRIYTHALTIIPVPPSSQQLLLSSTDADCSELFHAAFLLPSRGSSAAGECLHIGDITAAWKNMVTVNKVNKPKNTSLCLVLGFYSIRDAAPRGAISTPAAPVTMVCWYLHNEFGDTGELTTKTWRPRVGDYATRTNTRGITAVVDAAGNKCIHPALKNLVYVFMSFLLIAAIVFLPSSLFFLYSLFNCLLTSTILPCKHLWLTPPHNKHSHTQCPRTNRLEGSVSPQPPRAVADCYERRFHRHNASSRRLEP